MSGNKQANRQAICQVLMEEAAHDKDIMVLCSDSRGSASLASFAETYQEQFVEVGIAEQNLVGIAAGMAKCGKKVFAASPACFLSSRSFEQVKVDVAYSNTNVKLIGISGGISYGALGMSHHSAQDIASMASIPNMRVYLPSDSVQTTFLIKQLLNDKKPAYIRVGRNPVESIYKEIDSEFSMDKAREFCHEGNGIEKVLIVSCGEMVYPSLKAAEFLKQQGISTHVLDMYCIKPLDKETLLAHGKWADVVITVEEHSAFGGLGSMVSQVMAAYCPKRVINMALPDTPVISGTSKEVFDYYGLNAQGIVQKAIEILKM